MRHMAHCRLAAASQIMACLEEDDVDDDADEWGAEEKHSCSIRSMSSQVFMVFPVNMAWTTGG